MYFSHNNILSVSIFDLACQAPTSNSIANGGILIDQTHYSVSSALSYTCNSGFGTRDDTVTRCNRVADDFVWTLDSNPPSCLRSEYLVC